MIKQIQFFFIASILTLFGTCLSASDSTNILTVRGIERTFILHVPPSYDGTNATPLLFMFHGLGGTAAGAASDYYNWNATADSNNFLVVYPDSISPPGKDIEYPPGNVIFHNYDGTGKRWDVAHILTNDDCRCDSQDLDFVEAILDWAATNYNIRTSHVFTTGHSYGAYFSYYAAVCLYDSITAFGEHSGGILTYDIIIETLWWPIEIPGNQRQLQGILLHSPGDIIVPYTSSVILESQMIQNSHPVEFITLDSSLVHGWDKTKNQAQWDFFMAHAPVITNGTNCIVVNDYDGDRKTDLAVFHEASGFWFIALSATGELSYAKFGETGYTPVPADFDGDGKADLTVFHEASGYWYCIFSSTQTLGYAKLGETGYTPVSADFDGDGKTDLAVYNETTGWWYYILSSSGSLGYTKLGESGYMPVPSDYDGDSKADLAVFNETTGWWYYILSSTHTLCYTKLGGSGYAPVPADYDGDGKADLAVYNETTGWWYYILSSTWTLGYTKLGESGYEPVPGDYDGDGTTDLTVYQESTGYWYILLSGNSYSLSSQKLGEPGYKPVGR